MRLVTGTREKDRWVGWAGMRRARRVAKVLGDGV